MSKPLIAIVGRPNVGKSTLFNKLTGQRLSIVEDTPGVTRDRIYSACEWRNHEIMLVDTGGIEPYSDDIIISQMRRQAQMAIESAEVIILVVDMKSGITATDQEVAAMLQKSGKPIVLCVNKCDGVGEPPSEFYEFYNLGLGEPIAVSSLHGHGTGDLLDACIEKIDWENRTEYPEEYTKVAVIGKPNVGKSSLINKIFNQKQLARVSATPGKTATINFFRCGDVARFADLPGYGYAKVSDSERRRWSGLIEGYFHQDRDIRLVLSLLDIRHAPSADDLIDSELPFAVVLTKTDKLTNNQLRTRLEEIRTEIPCGDQVTLFPVSSMNGKGIEELRQTIESVVESE